MLRAEVIQTYKAELEAQLANGKVSRERAQQIIEKAKAKLAEGTLTEIDARMFAERIAGMEEALR